MHHTAVWQHSSNSNFKIVHNSIEHFLWNPSDFFSGDVLSCLWILFKLCLSGTPSENNSEAGLELENTMARGYRFDAKWVCPMGSYAWGIQVFCSVREMRHHLISQIEHLNTSDTTSHGTESFRAKPITPIHPIPKISTCLSSERKTEFVKTIDRQERTSSEKKSDGFHKKCSIQFWKTLMFELLLCCHTAATVHGTNIVFITEKV